MLLYFLKCGKNTEYKKSRSCKDKKTKEWLMLLSKCVVYDSKNSKFIKQQEVSALLHSFRMKTPLSKIPLAVPVFCFRNINTFKTAQIYI